MKKTLLLLSFLCCAIWAFAQTPSHFKYQGVARDVNQQAYANTALGLKVAIVLDDGSGSGSGLVQYSETHLAFTSPVGIFSVQIGTGQTTFGDIEEINWANGSYWLKVEMDVNGGDDYVYMGNSPILPVPLAVHALTVADKDDADADPDNELQTISFNPNTNQLTISDGNTINIPAGQADADADPQNEIQSIEFDENTNTLSLTNGGAVDLSSLEGGEGSDDQTLELNGTNLSIEGGNQVNLSVLQDGTEDADANPNNELQTISFDPNTNALTISDGNTINIPAGQADADADPQNEIQSIEFDENTNTLSLTNGGAVDLSSLEGGEGSDDQTLELNGTNLSIEGGNQVNLSVLQDGTEDADANPNNELQSISFDPNTNALTISDGNTINIPTGQADADADPENELQDLQLNGTNLSIEGGNQVNLAVIQDGTQDADADPENELQDLQLNGTNLSIEGGNQVNLAVIQDGTEDADANPNNELQTISFDPNTNALTISDGNTINIPAGQADADADPQNEIQSIEFDENTNTLSLTNGGAVDLSSLEGGASSDDQTLELNGTNLSIEGGNQVNLSVLQDGTEDADANPNNELQTISFDPNTNALTISDGNTINIPAGQADADADPENELQNLQLNGTNLSIEGGNQVNLAVIQDGTQDADADPENELQNLQLNGTNLSIEGGNQINLAVIQDGTQDADADPENELQDLQLNGTNLSIEGGNQVNLAVIQDGTQDADADPNNEIQSIQFDENTSMLTLTNGGTADLSSLEGGVDNDDQTLQLNGTTLSIEGGNQVNLAALQDGTEDADADPTNEIQSLNYFPISGRLDLDGQNPVFLPITDIDPNNEIQTIQFDPNSNDLMISGGNTINLPINSDDNDASPFNELQNLSLNGTLLTLSDGGQVNLSGIAGTSLWSENANNDVYTQEDVAIGFNESQLSTLEVKEDISVRDGTGELTIDMYSNTNGGNINFYNGTAQNETLISLRSLSDGGSIDVRDTDSEVMGELVSGGSGGVLRLFNPSGNETAALSAFSISSSLSLNQPDGDNSILFGASQFGGIGTFYGAAGDIVADIGRDASATNNGKIRLYDASGNNTALINGETGGEITLTGSVSDNAYIGTVNGSTELGKISIINSFGGESAGMYCNGLAQGFIFADVKNFRMDHPTAADKEIWYACVEGPEAAAYERGTFQLVDGEATVIFPDHFGLVANHETMTVLLTPLSADCKGLAVVEKTAEGFRVKELFQGTGTYEFDWEVKCVRKGYENYEPVREKKERL